MGVKLAARRRSDRALVHPGSRAARRRVCRAWRALDDRPHSDRRARAPRGGCTGARRGARVLARARAGPDADRARARRARRGGRRAASHRGCSSRCTRSGTRPARSAPRSTRPCGECSLSARLGEPVSPQTVRFIVRAQQKNGGFAWASGPAARHRRHRCRRGGACRGRRARQARDTGARVSAHAAAARRRLRAPARRGLERPVHVLGDPGVHRGRREAARGGVPVPQRMRRPDGSLRYSPRYATTPLWVSGQALPALQRRPFPLR